MFKPVPLFLAARYLRAKRKNRFASLVAGVSVAGISLGVAVLIIVLSVMNGFEREIAARILGVTADATVFGAPEIMRDWRALASRLERDPDVVAARPFIRGSGMLNARGIEGLLHALARNRTSTIGVRPLTEKPLGIWVQAMQL